MVSEESSSLSSDYTTKLQSLRQPGTGTKREIQLHREPRDKPTHLYAHCLFIYFFTKEAIIYNGEKTVSSISGAGKTGQLHVKE